MQTDDLEHVARKICETRGMKFVKRVGEGAFKHTFQVLASDDAPLALKVYKPGSSNKRDQREVNAMKRCAHKNIARLLSVENCTVGRMHYVAIVEEFLSGGTLTAKGPIAAPFCQTMGGQLVEAVKHIAGLNLVHRDIKPDNIMFRSDGKTPVLTDLGVVRDLSDSSITPTWAPRGPGTPFFAPLEQLNNDKELIDWRSDQFSLGVSLAYSIFGDHPYRLAGISDREVVDRVSSRQQVAEGFELKAAEIGLPALSRMIAPWPIGRYRTPDDLMLAWSQQKG